MKLALTEFGLGDVKDLETHIQLASDNGFEVIDTDIEKLAAFAEKHGLPKAKQFLLEHGISIGALQLPVNWREDDQIFQEGIVHLASAATLAQSFDVKTFYTFFLPSTKEPVINYLLKLTKRMKLCAQIVDAYGCQIAIEYVGPYHLRHLYENEFIYDLASTLEWIDVIDEKNVGVLLDSLHWHITGANVDEIKQLDKNDVAYVHINDAPYLPVEEILDNGRVLPGEGMIDLQGYLGAIQSIGYNGPVSLEILTKDQPKESSEKLARKSGIAIKRIFQEVGILKEADVKLVNE